MKLYILLLSTLLPLSLVCSNKKIDKSANYTQETEFFAPCSISIDEKEFEKCFGTRLDTYFARFPFKQKVPIYNELIPLTMSVFCKSLPLENNDKFFQQWCFKKTEKLVDCLIFAYLYNPDHMKMVDPENNYFSELNTVGSDTYLTPGLALIKKINRTFKYCCAVESNSYFENQLLSWLSMLRKMVPVYFDLTKPTYNYSLKNNKLYEAKHRTRVNGSYYLKKWFEDPKGKYYTRVKWKKVKELLQELYDLLGQPSVSGPFSGSTQPLLPWGKFKVTAAYADCDIIKLGCSTIDFS